MGSARTEVDSLSVYLTACLVHPEACLYGSRSPGGIATALKLTPKGALGDDDDAIYTNRIAP